MQFIQAMFSEDRLNPRREIAPTRNSGWDRLPEDLHALGWERDARVLFARLQRVRTWSEEGPILPRAGRAFVERTLDLTLPRIVQEHRSSDGATRLVLELGDGARVEAVHMPRDVGRKRVTICISSQVGCAMGCTFCATARMGLVRNMAAHEIVGQLLAVMHRLGPRSAEQVNIVFMGMGEPLHNVDAVMRALDVICDPAGLGVAPSRITVSTAGHVRGLERLARSRYLPELAVSVNGATNAVRDALMPIGKKWPLEALRASLAAWPRRPHQKITLEYVLLAGVNDDLASADALARWTGDLRHLINVIPFNAWGADSPYAAGDVPRFVERLREHGCLVKVRYSRGADVRAACGTLVSTNGISGASGGSRPGASEPRRVRSAGRVRA